MRPRLAVVLAGGLALVAGAACGDDGGDDGAATIGDAVEQLGCVEEDGGAVGLLRGTYGCEVDGEPVALHGTSGPSDHGEALRSLERRRDEAGAELCAGGAFPATVTVVDGGTWIAVAGSPAVAEAVVERIGGSVQRPEDGGGPPVGYDADRFAGCD